MRKAHRFIAVFAVLFAFFISITGIITQSMDLNALLRHAPATDPTMQGIRAGLDGPPNFRVIHDADYAATSLPAAFDYDGALGTVVAGAHRVLGAAPLSSIEFRMVEGRPVGQVASKGMVYRIDVATGSQVGAPAALKLLPNSTPSLRNTFKDIHRMRWFGGWGVFVDMIAGLLICAMIFTGLGFYWKLYRARARLKRKAPYWKAGDWWRSLHRSVAITAALFLTVIAVSGTILSISSIGVVVNQALAKGKRPGITSDVSKPLTDGELPGMLHTTLAAYRASKPGADIRVLQLRYFAGMPQGVVVGGRDLVQQHAFNARTGGWASFHEPGYPATGQTFGWQVDETVKMIHRGDYFGMGGRMVSLLCGFSLLYLAISGTAMYRELWRRRAKSGRRALFWS